MEIRRATSNDCGVLVDIWLRSVRASHAFLTEADIQGMLPLVKEAVASNALEVWALTDEGAAVGFMGIADNKIEALFLAPEVWGRGGGRMMVQHAAGRFDVLLVDVNEQNPQAHGFYEVMGFVVVGRSPVDGQGKPFPLLHMRRETQSGTPATVLEYGRQASRDARRRVVSARIVGIAWVVFMSATVFGAFRSGDRDPMRWPAAMFALAAGFYAVVSTLGHWFVLVPAIRRREKQGRNRRLELGPRDSPSQA